MRGRACQAAATVFGTHVRRPPRAPSEMRFRGPTRVGWPASCGEHSLTRPLVELLRASPTRSGSLGMVRNQVCLTDQRSSDVLNRWHYDRVPELTICLRVRHWDPELVDRFRGAYPVERPTESGIRKTHQASAFDRCET